MATKVDMRFIDSPADLEALANIDTDTLSALLANADVLTYHNAGTHNALPRSKDLGSKLTNEQSAAIRAGTFEGVYVGDSWTFENVPYSYVDENDKTQTATYSGTMRFADCDYLLKCGNTKLTTHHGVVVPDTNLFTAKMNDTATTEGGYVGSKMYKTYLRRAEAIFKACFGEEHILPHQEYLVIDVLNGRAHNGDRRNNRLVDLMDERMVYGSCIFDSASTDGGDTLCNRYSVACKQLNLFRHRPDLISNGQRYWLRNVVSGKHFACVGRMVLAPSARPRIVPSSSVPTHLFIEDERYGY